MSRWHEADAWAQALLATAGIFAVVIVVGWLLSQAPTWVWPAALGVLFVVLPAVWGLLRLTVLK